MSEFKANPTLGEMLYAWERNEHMELPVSCALHIKAIRHHCDLTAPVRLLRVVPIGVSLEGTKQGKELPSTGRADYFLLTVVTEQGEHILGRFGERVEACQHAHNASGGRVSIDFVLFSRGKWP